MRWTMALVAAALLAAACGGGQLTVHGAEDVSVSPGSGMTVQQAFPDITSGSQVTVVDPSGKVIGTGTLAYAKGDATAALQWEMAYVFTVTVPAGEARYGIQVGHGRGTVWFTPQQMAKGPALSLAG